MGSTIEKIRCQASRAIAGLRAFALNRSFDTQTGRFNGEGDKLAMQIVDINFPPVPKCEQLFNTDNDADTVKLVTQCYVNNLG